MDVRVPEFSKWSPKFFDFLIFRVLGPKMPFPAHLKSQNLKVFRFLGYVSAAVLTLSSFPKFLKFENSIITSMMIPIISKIT